MHVHTAMYISHIGLQRNSPFRLKKNPSDGATCVPPEILASSIGRSTFVPHTRDGLCNAHFNPSDIITESYTGTIKTTTATVSDKR